MLDNNISEYEWKSDNAEATIPNYNYFYTSTDVLPIDDTKYTVTVTDKYSCTAEAEYDYTAISTKAELSAEFWEYSYEPEGGAFYSYSEGTGESSPLKVVFSNESQKGENYRWFFGDTLWTNDVDTIFTNDDLERPERTYYNVQEDTVELLSISPYGCRDSIKFEIIVAESKIEEVPNVFTPNDDDANRFFRFDLEKISSLREIHITIYSKQGRKMHEFQGVFHDWEGWDGTTQTGTDAIEGVYIYVLEISSWDNVEYNNWYLSGKKEGLGSSKDSGIIYLYR